MIWQIFFSIQVAWLERVSFWGSVVTWKISLISPIALVILMFISCAYSSSYPPRLISSMTWRWSSTRRRRYRNEDISCIQGQLKCIAKGKCYWLCVYWAVLIERHRTLSDRRHRYLQEMKYGFALGEQSKCPDEALHGTNLRSPIICSICSEPAALRRNEAYQIPPDTARNFSTYRRPPFRWIPTWTGFISQSR